METEKPEDNYLRRLAFIKERHYQLILRNRQKIRKGKRGRPKKYIATPENINSDLEKEAEENDEAQQPQQNTNYDSGVHVRRVY